LDVAGGEVADLALAVGCAVHGGIVNDHVVPVGRFLNVELDAIGAYLVAFANTGNAT
jgi:energy-converting hydrogenase Eha subunit E